MIDEHLSKLKELLTTSTTSLEDFFAYAAVIKKDLYSLEKLITEKKGQLFEVNKEYTNLAELLQEAKTTIAEGQKIKEGFVQIEKERSLLEKEKEGLNIKSKVLENKELQLLEKSKRIQQILG